MQLILDSQHDICKQQSKDMSAAEDKYLDLKKENAKL